MSDAAATEPEAEDASGFDGDEGGFTGRALAWVEKAGNKVPNPAILFVALCLGVILLSQALDWANVSVTKEVAEPPAAQVQERYDGPATNPSYNVPDEPADGKDYTVKREEVKVKGLLTTNGIRFMFESFVPNFLGFAAIGVILVAMIGVGIAELSGLIGALIRKLVAISSPGSLTYIISSRRSSWTRA